jgi:hypothetical protein
MLEIARRKLSNGKAVGIDLLSDTLLKNRVVFDKIKHKLKRIFTSWYNFGGIPSYVKTGRVFSLSKSPKQSPYTPYGKLRSITIMVALMKMFEICVLQVLEKETKRLNFIPNN